MTLQVLELVLGVLLATGAVYLVLRPILRPAPPESAGAADQALDEGQDPEDDLSHRAVALRALTEIEFDRATGKLSDADYDALRAKYTLAALEALRETGSGTREAEPQRTPGLPLPASRRPLPVCPLDGPRPEPDAEFCSACGRRLGAAPGYCARCGTALEVDARYCARCGARVAA
ncbi:MAG: zinc ribbon domain-containing protein [Gemmatimonadales bacterium]